MQDSNGVKFVTKLKRNEGDSMLKKEPFSFEALEKVIQGEKVVI